MSKRTRTAQPSRLHPLRPVASSGGPEGIPGRPYIIFSLDYSHASAGPKALHRLCHELNAAGQEAWIGPGWAVNPEWDTPVWRGPKPPGDWVAVYPEGITGNPWGAPHVARWMLYFPGGREYDPPGSVFSWDPLFCDGVPVLQTPTVDLETYRDVGTSRAGALTFANKGRSDLFHVSGSAAPITLDLRLHPPALAAALNRAEILYTTDPHTGMTDLALLCGCPVVIVPTGERLEPAGHREQLIAGWAGFPDQLATFIAITQRVAVPA